MANLSKLTNKIIDEKLSKMMEIYIYAMVISKSTNIQFHNLSKNFRVLRKYNLNLTLAKCNFWVKVGKFMGYLIIKVKIEANLNQLSEFQI